MGDEIDFENGPKRSNFRLSWIRVKVIPLCTSHRVLSVYQISSKSKKLFVDGRTDGHLRPTNVIRSTRRSRPKKAFEYASGKTVLCDQACLKTLRLS